MAVIRGQFTGEHFTQVPNRWLRDPKLSAKAKGLLAYIASHAVGYRLTIKQIEAEFRDGRDGIQAGLRELETRGYLRRQQQRREGGVFGEWDFVIVQNPDEAATGKAVSGSDQHKGESAQVAAGGGKAASGEEQGQRSISAAQTATGNPASGSELGERQSAQVVAGDAFTGPGKSAPKKNRDKKTRDLGLEDQGSSSARSAAVAMICDATGASDDEAISIISQIKTDNPKIRKPMHVYLTGIPAEHLDVYLAQIRAEHSDSRQRNDLAAAFLAAKSAEHCEHGTPGGSMLHPTSGKPWCPMCRRKADTDAAVSRGQPP